MAVFTQLPNELLENIIVHTLPEGFESLALTCKHIYALCTPYIEHHNRLRWHFQNFEYGKTDQVVQDRLSLLTFPYTVCSAFNLIARIAVEPAVARYIQEADFQNDSLLTRGIPRGFATNTGSDKAVTSLLANSSYLNEADLDWQEYYAAIEEDLDATCYSQHAAAFVLSLLPNLRVLRLPKWWKPVAATDKLLDAIIRRSRLAHLPHHRASIAQVTRFEASVSVGADEGFDLDWATPFLALPHIRSFWGPSCVGTGDGPGTVASKYLHSGFNALEAVHFMSASIDAVAMEDFLKHAPCLKTLRYSHSTKENSGPQDWDPCRLIAAIEREVGSHLVELSISIDELHGSIVPGKVSMRGFHRLQKLELPLEIAICNRTTAALADQELSYYELFLSDLVPASASQVCLISQGTNHDKKVLSKMFTDFASKKDSQMPALKEIYLFCPGDAEDPYREECAKLAAEAKKVGVALDLVTLAGPLTWDGEQSEL